MLMSGCATPQKPTAEVRHGNPLKPDREGKELPLSGTSVRHGTTPYPHTSSAAPMSSLAPGTLKTPQDAPLVPDPGAAAPISPPGGLPVSTPAGRVTPK